MPTCSIAHYQDKLDLHSALISLATLDVRSADVHSHPGPCLGLTGVFSPSPNRWCVRASATVIGNAISIDSYSTAANGKIRRMYSNSRADKDLQHNNSRPMSATYALCPERQTVFSTLPLILRDSSRRAPTCLLMPMSSRLPSQPHPRRLRRSKMAPSMPSISIPYLRKRSYESLTCLSCLNLLL